MKKLLTVFLFGTITCCSQETNNTHWPTDRTETQVSGVAVPATLTAQQQKNLAVLCRVWGFLKYFHPKVATGAINADKALFAIMPAVLEAANNESLDLVLFKWIEELREINTGTTINEVANIFIEPSMQWVKKDSLIAGKLRPQLRHILNNRHIGEKYYVKYAAVRNPDFSYEFKYENVKGEDDGMRMLALFRYWNTIEYFFPSKYLTADNWDEILEKYIPAFAAAKTDSVYRSTCWRLVASIHDTHSGGIQADRGSQKYKGKFVLPVGLADVEGDMTVLFHLSDSIKALSPLKAGDRILAINGVDTRKLIDSVKPYVSASNPSTLNYYSMLKLCRSYKAENTLTIQRGNDKMELTVFFLPNGYSIKDQRAYYSSMYPMYKKIEGDIGYINLGKIKAASLPEIFTEFEHTSGLVIDIRNYPSEFMPFALGKYLKPKPSPFVRFTFANLELPGRFTMEEPLFNGENNRDYYKGKIVILVNESSISQAEYTTMALRTAPNAIVMGSQTCGADGNVSYVYLPGGMASWISGLGVYYPDKKATQGIGIIPDIEVKPTIKGIMEGKDEVLEKAMQYIRNK